MARYEITSPEGGRYEVTAPDDASEQDVMAYAQQQFGQAQPKPAMVDVLAGTRLGRMAIGAASPFLAAGQFGANIGSKISGALGGATTGQGSGEWVNQQLADLEAAKQRGMALHGTEGMDWMGLLGQLYPASVVAKTAQQALPQAMRAANAGILARAGTGAVAGGAAAASSPITSGGDYFTEKAKQTGLGMGLGGAIPLAGGITQKAWNVGSNFVNPILDLWRQSGPANIARRGLTEAIGKQNLPKVRQALSTAPQYVPGSKPTSAEAVAHLPEGSPLIALQKAVAGTKGGPSKEFGVRINAQQKAREAYLEQIAGGVKPEAAEAARTAASKANYEPAMKQVVKADATLKDLLKRPIMQQAEQRAQQIAANKGEHFATVKTFYPVKKLHYMKLALDDMLKNPERFALGKTEEAAIAKTKDEFVTWVAGKSKAYDFARSEHARLSIPFNQSKVREGLQDKLLSATGKETPGSYLKAVDESAQLLKKATGQPRYQTIEDVLSPQDAAKARAVAADLARSYQAGHPVQPTDLSGMKNLSMADVQKVNLLNRYMAIANSILTNVGKQNTEPLVDAYMSRILRNPPRLAAFLGTTQPQTIPPRYYDALQRALQQAPPVAGTVAGRNF